MAIAITAGPNLLPISSVPTVRATVTTITGDTSYPTGGTAITAAQLGLSVVGFAIASITASSGSNNAATSAVYNTSTNKLQMLASTDAAGVPLAEAAATTNLSGLTVTIVAFGE